ncbi:MAG TPA: dienelactone hydrolase family protein [Caulobacteraceae bacterium]|nr:dienelactone hydrolase family protein [Caulobacteraceae bacterium]
MGKNVEYSDRDTTCEGYFVAGAGEGRRPCVLVAHDWAGLGDSLRAGLPDLAQEGWTVFALDNYGKGVRGEAAGDNSHLMSPFMADRAMLRRRLLAGVAAAKAQPNVDSGKMAVMGYCFGGLCALDLARAGAPEIKGAVSIHGVFAPPSLGAQQPIHAKVLALHGWDDPMATPRDVAALAKELTDAGADWQIHAFGHAMHAFTVKEANRPQMGLMYNEAAARRSRTLLKDFFREVFA